MSAPGGGVNVEFYKAQALKHLTTLDHKLLTNEYVRQIQEKTQIRPSSALIRRTPGALDASLCLFLHSPPPSVRSLVSGRSFLAIGVGTFAVLFLVWGVGAQFVTNLVGFAYPLYESFRSLHSAQTSSSVHSQQQWLTYWVVYALFALVESLTDFFLYWIPLYHLVKIAFLAWCFLPSTRGAELLYYKLVDPVLARFEGRIDSAGREGKRVANRVISDLAEDAAKAAADGENFTAST